MTPEWIVGFGIASVVFSAGYIPSLLYWRSEAKTARQMITIMTSNSHRMRQALQYIASHSLCLETRSVARKVLEEK